MTREDLFEIALEYKKTKLWKQLYDSELFALKLSNGEIGYCSVMGVLGEHIALALYIGRDGLDSFRKMYEADDAPNELMMREIMVSQDCIQCSFENKEMLSPKEIEEARQYAKAKGVTLRGHHAYPQFYRYRLSRYPWPLDDPMEEQLLYEALSAAIEIAEKLKTTDKSELGFSEGEPDGRSIPFLEKVNDHYQMSLIKLPPRQKKPHPSPIIHDEMLIARLAKKRKPRLTWACEVIMLPYPVTNEGEGDMLKSELKNAPYFPYMLLIVDCNSGMIIQTNLIYDYDQHAEEMLAELTRIMDDHGVPSEILVRDDRTKKLISALAKQIGIKVTKCDDLPFLDEIEEELIDQMNNLDNSDQNDESMMDEFIEMFMELDDETIRAMPSVLRKQLLELESAGALPKPVAERVRKLFK